MNMAKNLVIFAVIIHLISSLASGATSSIADQCANEFQKVTACLTYATGKQDTPSKECCTSATDIKAKNPVCLCYIIMQIHDGSNPQLKSMGIQEDRLLRLPSACDLQNASSADCPKLLNLPSNSPDAAFFTNANTSATTPSSTTTSPPATPGKASPSGNSTSPGFRHQVHVVSAFVITIFICSFLNGRM